MMKSAKRLALIGLLVLPVAAFTFGGWAVTTVIDVPESAVAGAPIELAYDLRQHGVRLASGFKGKIEVTASQSSAEVDVIDLGNGRYRSTVTFPQPGEWTIRVKSGFWPTGVPLLPILVVAKGAPAPAPMPAGVRGKHLFVAKGCVSCHTHQLTKGYNTVKGAPDLSEPKFVSAYLTKFLADPSVKTNWATDARMPNLGLKPAEITALVAFLNRETNTASR
jgi:mono/diheme cytochrome c family protein